MTVSVPTTNDVKGAAKDGAIAGGALGLGSVMGRSMLGPGLGTAVGGVAAASTLSGNARETASIIAVERGMSELFAGAGGSSGGSSGGRNRM